MRWSIIKDHWQYTCKTCRSSYIDVCMWVYMCLCMCICCVYVFMCMCVCAYFPVYICKCVCMVCLGMCLSMCTCICVCIYMYVCVHICTCVFVCICMSMCVYVMNTWVHVYVHAFIPWIQAIYLEFSKCPALLTRSEARHLKATEAQNPSRFV